MFKFDINNKVELPTFILRNKSLHNLGSIKGVQAFNPTFNFNSCQEFSCEVYKFENGVENPLWNKIKDNKIIYIPELQEQYEIGVSIDDEDSTKKTITGKSLCEAELSQRILRDIEINTESDISRDDYKISVFYDETNAKTSILNRILDKVPHYKIGYVAPTLRGISRAFSIDGTSIYDFMTGDLAEEYDCLFVFDSLTRTINCYDLLNYCPSCKKRFDSSESHYKMICPKCNNADNIIKGYGDDTTVFISKENLANSINLQTNKDEVKNMLKIIGGDDDITAAVSYLTMNNGYIINITEGMKSDMSTSLAEKVDDYSKKLKELEPEYEALTSQYYTSLTRQLELEHSMAPTVDIKNDSTAQKELDKIQIETIAFPKNTVFSQITIENSIKALAKLEIDTGHFSFSLNGNYNASTKIWNGSFTVTNLSTDESATSNKRNITITNTDYQTYIEQKIAKTLGKSEVKDIEYDWSQYSLQRLSGFQSAYQDVVDILINMKSQALNDNNQTETEYNEIYQKYYDKLIAIQKQIVVREKEIDDVKKEINNTLALMTEKQKLVDMKTFFGSNYVELCTYLREDTYSNDNYISDGLSDTEVINRAKELIEAAKKECSKQSEISYTLTADINNLMVMKDFEPLWSRFKLGNWLRLEADEKIYRLRLISYSFDFSDLSKINVEFSNLSKVDGITTDTQSILEQASSLSTTISYIQQQSQKNNATSLILDNWTQQGFIDTLGMVSDANNQSIVMDSHGLLAQMWDEFKNEYDSRKIKIINNGVYLTTDNFKTMKCGIGEFYYIDPVTKQKVQSYGLIADTIIGKIILGEKVGIYNANNSMSFDENGLVITTNGSDDKQTNAFTIQKQTIVDDTVVTKKMMYIDENGNLCMGAGTSISWDDVNSPNISNITGLTEELNGVNKTLDDMNDSYTLVPSEKLDMKYEWDKIQNEYSKNIELAEVFNLSTDSVVTKYTASYSTLEAEICNCGLDEDKLNENTILSTLDIYTKLNDYYSKNVDLATKINTKSKELADIADETANLAVSDSVITPSEKRDLIVTQDNIKQEYTKYTAIAKDLDIDYTNYTTNYNNLITLLNSILKDLTISTKLNTNKVADYKNKFNSYYTQRSLIIKQIQDKTNTNVDNAQSSANEANKKAQESLDSISEMSADNKITPVEKIQLREKYQQEEQNYTTIVTAYKDATYLDRSNSKSTTLNINESQQYKNYTSYYSNIKTMCQVILNDMTSTYNMSDTGNYSRTTYNTHWKKYYNSYQTLLNFLNQVFASTATRAEIEGLELIERLGYDGTSINETHINSPVIEGGKLFIGNRDNIFAEITKDGKLIARACEIREQSTIAGFTFVKYKKYDNSEKKEIEIIGLENNTSQEIANVGIHSSGGWAMFAGARSIFTENPNSLENIRGEYHLPHQFSVGHEGNVYCTNLMIGNRTPVFNANGTLNVEATSKNSWTGGNLSVRGNGVFYKGVIIGNNTNSGSLNLIGECYIGNKNKPGTITAIATVNIGEEEKYSNVNIIGNVTIGNSSLTTKPIINMFGSCNISNGLTVAGGTTAFKTNVHIGTSDSNKNLNINGNCKISGDCEFPSIVGTIGFKGEGDIHIGTDKSTKDLHVNGCCNVSQNLDIGGNLSVRGNGVFYNGLTVAGGTTAFKTNVHIGTDENEKTRKQLHVNGYCKVSQNLDIGGNLSINSGHVAIKGSSAGKLAILGYKTPDTWVWINTGLVNNDMEQAIVISGNLRVDGGLYITGNAKARLVKTEHFGNVTMSAYETTTPYFGDIGSGETDEFCKCYIYLDEIFKETIIENTEYYIFLQVYGNNNVYVSEKYEDYFVIKSNSPSVKFDWEIKCRQKDTDNMRMDVIDIETEEDN